VKSAAAAGHKITEHTIDTGHSEIATEFLREGENLADKGDVIQVSEKLYKAAEEAVKGLSEEARKKGRWTVKLLEKAMNRFVGTFGEDIRANWDAAWFLHVEGFHETRFIDINSVKSRLNSVTKLVELERKQQHSGVFRKLFI